jgi:Spy/CpxP family protein refolding chaperone
MNSLCKLGLTLIAAGALALPADAQERQRRGGGPGGPGGSMLDNPQVQKELKLTDEQVSKVKNIVKEIREKHQDDFAKLRDAAPEERREKFMELRKTVQEETHKALADAKVFNPDQEKRLHQLELQTQVMFQGPQVFTDAKVAGELKLTDDQKEKLKTLAQDFNKEREELRQGGPGPEMFQKMAALTKESMEKVNAVLTEDQKKTWKEMTGAPFEMMRFPGRRGGNREGGGGGA